MSIGISSWTYPWAIGVPGYPPPRQPLGASDLLARAAVFGAGAVQIADNLPLDRLSAADLAALQKQAKDSGLVLEAGTRGVVPEHLRAYLRIARSLGATLLRTLTHTQDSQPDLGEVEAWLREVLPEFAQAGVSLGLENYERHTSRELADLVDRIGSEHLGVCLDTVNSFGALESPEQVLDHLAPHVINLHVKDFEIERIPTRMGFAVTGRPAGEGRLKLDVILERLGRFGRAPNLILEQWPPFVDSVERSIEIEAEWARRGIRFLQRYDGRT
ncbi:MAG TPA: sugar phosphate isomerase/epimerase family protein [Bryobacteraceae bacterium]|jgi:sugar phosphate isomerase/epimerase|nr:sugar phosphate isomerase/epimerase family protein [Bryobacteraceae bacterium]